MKDLGPASSDLGIWITRDRNTQAIWIDQEAYIENALKRFDLIDANNTKTPLSATLHLEKNKGTATTETKTLFQQMIRTLIYATISTRPDITFAATSLSWYNSNPSDSHVKYGKHIEISLRHKRILHKIWWEFKHQIDQIFGLRLGWESRWSPLHIRSCFLNGKWMHFLSITMTKDSCTFSGRSWIYGTSQHWMTSCMA